MFDSMPWRIKRIFIRNKYNEKCQFNRNIVVDIPTLATDYNHTKKKRYLPISFTKVQKREKS